MLLLGPVLLVEKGRLQLAPASRSAATSSARVEA